MKSFTTLTAEVHQLAQERHRWQRSLGEFDLPGLMYQAAILIVPILTLETLSTFKNEFLTFQKSSNVIKEEEELEEREKGGSLFLLFMSCSMLAHESLLIYG